MNETSKPHSMYENEHAEYLFAKVLAPHVCRMPVEQDRLDACHHLARLVEQKEAADRVLTVADQLAEWCRVTTSVEGVFSNNLGAQAQAQGMANLVVRYVAARESYPASLPETSGRAPGGKGTETSPTGSSAPGAPSPASSPDEARNLDGTNHWTPHDDPRGIGR